MLLLGYDLATFTELVERAGYTWMRRYFATDEDMMQLLSTSPMFWKWWINEWQIRDTDFLFETSLRFLAEPLTGIALQYALEEYVEKHAVMKLKIVPNRLVTQELNRMIREKEKQLTK